MLMNNIDIKGHFGVVKTNEMVVCIEAGTITKTKAGKEKILSLKITTNNHGYCFDTDYNTGKDIKIGDIVEIKRTLSLAKA